MKKTYFYFVTAVALLFLSSGSGFAQVNPTLGTTADFVIFSSMGDIINVGTSCFTGFVGTNAGGTCTGFETATGDFEFHDSDALSQQAAADLLVLYNQLNAATGTALTTSTLGDGQVLTPGVYTIGDTTYLSGDTVKLSGQLILDGQGNPNAEFIIKIGGGLSTAAYSEIVLINGTQASNIYWLVEGPVVLGSYTKIKGTLISNNGNIDLLESVNIEGRILATNGCITTLNSICFDKFPILTPVTNRETSSIAVFSPNPMRESVVITLPDASGANQSQLKIFNTLGKELISKTITNSSTTVETNLPTGIYYYKLTGKDNKIQTGKLMSK